MASNTYSYILQCHLTKLQDSPTVSIIYLGRYFVRWFRNINNRQKQIEIFCLPNDYFQEPLATNQPGCSQAYNTILIGSSISLSSSKSTDEKDSKQQISKYKLDFSIFLGATSFRIILYVISISCSSLDVSTKSLGFKSAGQKVTPGLTKYVIKIIIIGLRASFKIKISSQS